MAFFSKWRAARAATKADIDAVRLRGDKDAADRLRVRDELKQRARDKHAQSVNRGIQMMDIMEGSFPKTFHSITVHVKGGPGADLRRIWFLAVSACAGRYRKHGLVSVRGQAINAEWDVTGKEASINYSYTVSGTLANIAAMALNSNKDGTAPRPENGLQLLMRGPDQVTRGGRWQDMVDATFISKVVAAARNGTVAPQVKVAISTPAAPFSIERPGTETQRLLLDSETGINPDALREELRPFTLGLPGMSGLKVINGNMRSVGPLSGNNHNIGFDTANPPLLMDAERIITTGEKLDRNIQGVKPPVDGISRVNLANMIAAALASPGYSVIPPYPQVVRTQQPLASSGVYVPPTTTSIVPGAKLVADGLMTVPADLTGS